MRRRLSSFTVGELPRRPDARGISVSGSKGIVPTLEGLATIALGGSLRETLPWILLVSLWMVFIAAVTALTVGESFPIVVLPCRIAGALGVAAGGLVGGLMIVLRYNSRSSAASVNNSRLSSDW